MTLILFQKGATGTGFQIGKLWWQVLHARFWMTSGLIQFGWENDE